MTASNLFRFNVIDQRGVSSFVGPAHALKVIAAACSQGAESLQSVLKVADEYDAEWARDVRLGLHRFDEHNIDSLSAGFARVGERDSEEAFHPFRVLDATTRQRSMQPASLGLVVFNLKERRIIQIQNRYSELMRNDRGRVRRNGLPTRQLFSYSLSDAWSIV
ncbi:MAG: hypothetical protein WBA46_12450, partial [Thermomicrobiales bacterium]